MSAKKAKMEFTPEALEEFEERAGIIEYDGGLPREEAEARAYEIVRDRPRFAQCCEFARPIDCTCARAWRCKRHGESHMGRHM